MNLTVLTGAGISAESGLTTFRGQKGLWKDYDVTELASPKAWEKNPELVLEFYNKRRRKLLEAKPNEGHKTLAALEDWFNINIITQNIDDLHERAGSTHIIHLHGELKKARSTADPSLIYTIEGAELNPGDTCEKGSQLRPHVVWFGEPVQYINEAIALARQAEVFVVAGTSLAVYPAAGLLNYVHEDIPVYVIDPEPPDIQWVPNPGRIHTFAEKATSGLKKLKDTLTNA